MTRVRGVPTGEVNERAARARRRGALARRVAAVPIGLLAALAGCSGPARAAYGDVATATFSIEAPLSAVSGVVASPGTVPAGDQTSFDVKFRVTSALAGSPARNWVSVVPSSPLGTVPSALSLVDDSASTCSQAGSGGGGVSTSSLTVDLASGCSLAVGDIVEVDFWARPPAGSRSFSFSVSTSANSASAASNPVVVSSTPPTFSASSQSLGASATYTISGASWTDLTLSQSFTVVQLSAGVSFGASLSWSAAQAGYSVTVTTPAGATTHDEVLSATPATATLRAAVTLTLVSPVGFGDSLTIRASGTNPAATSSDTVSVEPEATVGGSVVPVAPGETTNAVLFGSSLGAVTVAVSPPVAGVLATYTVGFQAGTAVTGGSPGASICLGEAAGPTNFASETAALVSDTTAGWHFSASAGETTYPAGSPPSNPGCDAFDNGAVIFLPSGYDIRAGDTVTLVLVNVTNPRPGTVDDFSVSTSSDTVASRAAPYPIAASAVAGVLVSVSPATTGALASYTVSGLVASAAMAGGSTKLTLEGAAGTVFPNDPAYYNLEDLTAPSGSGVVSAVSGGGTSTVAIVVPKNIGPGDHLIIAVQDVTNPASAGDSYTVTVLGPVTGSRALPPFPRANSSYPNGAIVDFGGTDYVFAGGHAFGVPSPPTLYSVERVDHAEPQTAPGGAVPPETPPRPGTLIFTRPVNGDPTIYVAGTDGDLHGFSTAAQLLAEGYDTALVVTVPSLGGMAVGAPVGQLGSAASALATSADGAVVASSGNWFVLAGGRAFSVPAGDLGAIFPDRARPVVGNPTPAQQTAAVANGVLLSVHGAVYVSYEGGLWPFKTRLQLAGDGYGGTAAVPVPATETVPLVSAYSGS